MKTVTNVAADVVNAIRNSATINFKNYVPYVTPNADNLASVGNIICDNPALRNEFINVLINGIYRKTIAKLEMTNPFNIFKRTAMTYGWTAQEVWLDLASVFDYKPDTAYTTELKRVVPDAKSAFHCVNYQKYYQMTIDYNTLRGAFEGPEALESFVSGLIDNLYKTLEYDEFQSFKYLIAHSILKGYLYPLEVAALSNDTAIDTVVKMKTLSGLMKYPSREYNPAGVLNSVDYDNQYIISSVPASALLGNNVFAYMYQQDYTKFSAHYFEIDGFGKLDIARLNELYGSDPNYYEFSADELAALDTIPAIIIDKNYFYCFDNLNEFNTDYVKSGMYWNYWLHTWRCYSTSPFANAAVLLTTAPEVTNISITPSAANVVAGTVLQLSVNVEGNIGTPLTVNWTSDSADVTVSATGLVTVPASVAGGTSVTITATSTVDNTKKATATITVVAAV